MKRIIPLSLLLALVATVAFAQATPPTPDPWSKRISITFEDTPVVEAVERFLKDSGVSYTIGELGSPPENYKVTVTFRDVPLERGLKLTLQSAGLTFRKEGNVVTIYSAKAERKLELANTDPLSKPITVTFKDTPLVDALEMLLKDSGMSYIVGVLSRGAADSKVTAVFRDVTLDQALREVAKSAGLVFYRQDNPDLMRFVDPVGPVPDKRRLMPYRPRGSLDSLAKPITIAFKATPPVDAVQMLLKDSGVSYTVGALPQGAEDYKVTAVFHGVTLEWALYQTLQSAGLAYRTAGGVIGIFSPEAEQQELAQEAATRTAPVPYRPAPAAWPGSPTKGPPVEEHIEKVPLHFVDAGAVLPLLTMISRAQVMNSSGKALVLRGTDESIQEAKDLIHMIDNESSLPRPIRIKVKVDVECQQGDTPKKLSAETESVGAEGANIPLTISGACDPLHGPLYPTPLKSGDPGAWTLELRVNLTPTIFANDQLSLTGIGTIHGTVPIEFSKDFDVAVAVEPGTGTVIASGMVDLAGGRVSFKVSVSATVEKGRLPMAPAAPQMGGYGNYGGAYGSSYGSGGGYGSYGGGMSGGYRSAFDGGPQPPAAAPLPRTPTTPTPVPGKPGKAKPPK